MSNIAKSISPVAPAATKSKDWTKASTPELQSGSEDKSDVLDAKVKERCRHKQVKREEKQHREEAERRACEEVEAKACEDAERAKAEAERKAREEGERQVRKQAEKDRAMSRTKRVWYCGHGESEPMKLMQRTHPRSVERLSRLEGYRQPSLSISRKVKTILMRRMNTSSL